MQLTSALFNPSFVSSWPEDRWWVVNGELIRKSSAAVG